MMDNNKQATPKPSFNEALKVWFKIGCLSFGGPAGQIALMHRIVVDEKRWVPEAQYLHALNFCMLLPGPEAQQSLRPGRRPALLLQCSHRRRERQGEAPHLQQGAP